MQMFYGLDSEKQILVVPKFLFAYLRLMNKKPDDFYIPPDKQWLLDSSGFTLSVNNQTYQDQKNYSKYWSEQAYAGFINSWKPTHAFTQDFAFYSKVKKTWTKEEIKQRFLMTAQRTSNIIDNLDDKNRLANVLQGLTMEDYLENIDLMKQTDTLTDFLGIGSMVGRTDIFDIVTEIKKNVPARIKLHGLGVKKIQIKKYPILTKKLYSADTAVWFTIGRYTLPPTMREAFLKMFVDDMESFISSIENKSYINEFETD